MPGKSKVILLRDVVYNQYHIAQIRGDTPVVRYWDHKEARVGNVLSECEAKQLGQVAELTIKRYLGPMSPERKTNALL